MTEQKKIDALIKEYAELRDKKAKTQFQIDTLKKESDRIEKELRIKYDLDISSMSDPMSYVDRMISEARKSLENIKVQADELTKMIDLIK